MNLLRIIIELILLLQFTQCSELTVNTTYGCLIGKTFKTRNGNIVAAFHGIPYAKPPISELRFQDPQPPESWSGVREAYNFGSACVQIPYVFPPVSTTKMGNEDCLYLSVYSPNLKPTNLFPVLVYFHGAAFFSGSSETDVSPEFFLDFDVVVVLPNFRVGVLGFLTMEDDVMPGNMGLKDQSMVLIWIQNNIANFGGDPNQVTLIGDCAGAAYVSYHMYSPMSRDLFHRAISQSGTALAAWASTPPGVARSRAIKMAQLHNCPTESSKVILDCLNTKNAYEITESYSSFMEFQFDPVVIFAPIFDKNSENPFLPFNPHDAEPAPIPWIVSVCSLEGLVRTGAFVQIPDTLIEFDRNFLNVAPISLFYDTTATNPEEVTKQIREFYFDDQPITMSLFRNLTDMYTDSLFIWPAVESLQKHKGPHYFYYFNYLGEHSFQDIFAGRRILTGTCLSKSIQLNKQNTNKTRTMLNATIHSCQIAPCINGTNDWLRRVPVQTCSADLDDGIYLWNNKNPIEIGVPTSSQDLYISNLLTKLFYNFASSGEPTPSGFEFDWPQWDDQQQNFISFENSGVTFNRSLLPDKVQFWSQLNFRDKVD